MTGFEFFHQTGREPEQDDLERANCELAGQIGHVSCGLCKHAWPVHRCPECFFREAGACGRRPGRRQ